MIFEQMYEQLRNIAHELETNSLNYSADEQAFLRMAATSIAQTVLTNYMSKKYSYDEDD